MLSPKATIAAASAGARTSTALRNGQERRVVAPAKSARGELVAGELVVGLVGEAVLRDGGDGLAGNEEGDGEVAERRQVERDGIADDLGAGGDVDGGLTVEERGYSGALDGAFRACECDVGGADLQGCGAERVAEDDADTGAAEGHVDDLAQGGVIGEVAVAVACGDGRRWTMCRPSGHRSCRPEPTR